MDKPEKFLCARFMDKYSKEELWHYRCGHTAFSSLNNMKRQDMVEGFNYDQTEITFEEK